MRWINGALHSIRRLRFAFLGVLVVLVVASVHAQSPGSGKVQVVPQTNRWVRALGGGFESHASAMARYQRAAEAAAQTTYHRVPVSASAATLGRLTKGAVRRVSGPVGWYFVLKDLVDGAGWAIDELGKQVQRPGVPPQDLQGVVYCNASQTRCASTGDYLASYYNGRHTDQNGGGTFSGCAWVEASTLTRCTLTFDSGAGSTLYNIAAVKVQVPSGATNVNPSSPASEVTDAELGDLVKTRPDVVNAILIDPQTGAPIQYPELVDAMNNLRKQLEQQHGAEPGPDVTPDPDYENKPQPGETEWPAFCDWATKVCELVDWVMEPNEVEPAPEVPWEDPDIEPSTWTSGLGGGSCPAPIGFSVSIGGQTASPEFDMTGLCSFGSMMRPLVIAIAMVVAAYILGGIRGSKDA